jgi:hypothetical protein
MQQLYMHVPFRCYIFSINDVKGFEDSKNSSLVRRNQRNEEEDGVIFINVYLYYEMKYNCYMCILLLWY